MQARMIHARRQLDYQAQVLDMQCSISPRTLSWKFPFYPPTDATRNDPAAFGLWRERVDYWRKLGEDEAGREEIMTMRCHWVDPEGRRLTDARQDVGSMHRQCWVYYDVDLRRMVAHDHLGRMCRPQRLQGVQGASNA